MLATCLADTNKLNSVGFALMRMQQTSLVYCSISLGMVCALHHALFDGLGSNMLSELLCLLCTSLLQQNNTSRLVVNIAVCARIACLDNVSLSC